jgi:hypothetical protein
LGKGAAKRGRRVVEEEPVVVAPVDKRTASKLSTLQKIFDVVGIERPCTVEELARYDEWRDANRPWLSGQRYFDMVAYAQSIVNPDYTAMDIYNHGLATQGRCWEREKRCPCMMCNDKYNAKGFREFNDPNYEAYLKIHGLF